MEQKREKAQVAKLAWEKAPLGETEDFMGHRVVKDKKMVVISPLDLRGFDTFPCILAFPKLEHFKNFKKASIGVDRYGIAEDNPGAVGTVKLRNPVDFNEGFLFIVGKQIPETVDRKLVELDYAQAHFKTSGAFSPSYNLPRKLATEYYGWRLRCLKEAVLLAKKSGRILIASKKLFVKPESGLRKNFLEDLKKAAAFHSSKFIESEDFIAIVPRFRK